MFDFSKYPQVLTSFFLTYGIRLLGAVFLLLFGFWLIQRVVSLVNRLMQKHEVDPTLRPFLSNILNVSLKILLIIAVVAQLGVAMSAVVAVLGSAGLAIGLALQGSLSNFAGGILILVNKPFRVGDYIETMGVAGRVCLINILNSVIKTHDNKTIYIPNGPLANSTITNFDVEASRRIDIRMLMQYGNDVGLAKKLVSDMLHTDERVLSKPAPQVVTENTETGVALIIRVWATREDIGSLTVDLHEQIGAAFERENITLHGPRKVVS